MENELLKIFDQQRNPIGIASREEIHKAGHWHETFHCWFISFEDGLPYIYLQKRSAAKKDYPNLLDITAAGHILADESIRDGVREIKEELGVEIAFDELVPLEIIEYSVTRDGLIDNEIAHVFLYKSQFTFDAFKLQKEEVSGLVKASFTDFTQLWSGKRAEITVEGFEIDQLGRNNTVRKKVEKHEFVPHELSYYEDIIKLISEEIVKE
ncbi:NUDIX domain-containing protein [Cytobacillus depressus]|uniref:NUDIX domain-containing protein n=1 Tax=Cytobacillus depressus TaxID=1602942 RepID=A0A6L3V2R7_9BACI|nr:NUDIX domain-containing protein [Cytobacillus depressus]KAB2333311.1 NUDIX domain-containing protein [Cytobacillus depressus]